MKKNRPIVFIGHSLGGILILQVILPPLGRLSQTYLELSGIDRVEAKSIS
jgi:predicted alpha/beta superfamily hydrolase